MSNNLIADLDRPAPLSRKARQAAQAWWTAALAEAEAARAEAEAEATRAAAEAAEAAAWAEAWAAELAARPVAVGRRAVTVRAVAELRDLGWRPGCARWRATRVEGPAQPLGEGLVVDSTLAEGATAELVAEARQRGGGILDAWGAEEARDHFFLTSEVVTVTSGVRWTTLGELVLPEGTVASVRHGTARRWTHGVDVGGPEGVLAAVVAAVGTSVHDVVVVGPRGPASSTAIALGAADEAALLAGVASRGIEFVAG